MEVGGWSKRSEQRRGTRQVALGLCDTGLCHNGIHVIRCDIQNLLKLSQCFGETTKHDIGSCVRGEQVNVARIEPLGFVEIRFASVPLASPPCNVGQRLRYPAAIREELTCLLEVTHRG